MQAYEIYLKKQAQSDKLSVDKHQLISQEPTFMYPNQVARAHQQSRIKNIATNSDWYAFFNLLTSPALLDKVEALAPDHRERLFPPTETLSMFVAQALMPDRSCQKAVDEASASLFASRKSIAR